MVTTINDITRKKVEVAVYESVDINSKIISLKISINIYDYDPIDCDARELGAISFDRKKSGKVDFKDTLRLSQAVTKKIIDKNVKDGLKYLMIAFLKHIKKSRRYETDAEYIIKYWLDGDDSCKKELIAPNDDILDQPDSDFYDSDDDGQSDDEWETQEANATKWTAFLRTSYSDYY
jgi:hypothetical protein